MEAKHPITKQTIKIIQTNAQIVKDNKTLLHVLPSFEKSNRYTRYTTVVSEFEAIEKLSNKNPHIVVIKNNTEYDKYKDILKTNRLKDTVFFVGKEVEDIVGKVEQFLVIEELYNYYPMIEYELTNKSNIDEIIVALAYIFRFNKLICSFSKESNKLIEKWLKHSAGIFLTIPNNSNDNFIPKTYHIFQYYNHSKKERMKEIDFAFKQNIENEYIDNIICVTDEGVNSSKIPTNDKIKIVMKDKRMSFKDSFEIARENVPADQNNIMIFSNADISFDETLRHLYSFDMKKKRIFLALLRYEYDFSGEHKIFGPRADSQDCWIFSRDNLDFDTNVFDYHYGIPGCDNIISIDMFRNKFVVCNPAFSIKTYHHHSSNIRNYSEKDILYRPYYMYVDPTYLQSFQLVKDFGGYGTNEIIYHKLQTRQSYEVKINSISTSNKFEKSYICTPANNNQLIHFNDSFGNFVCPNGLISNYDSIFIGKSKLYEQMWTQNTISTLTPTLEIPCMIASTKPMESKNLGKFILHNIPDILQIRAYAYTKYGVIPEFFVPPFENINDFLQNVDFPILNDKITNITINPYRTDVQYMSKNVFAHIHTNELDENYSDTNSGYNYSIEQVELLRSLFEKQINKKESGKESSIPTVCIVVKKEGVLTPELGEQIKKIHFVMKEGTEEEKRWNVIFLEDTSEFKQILEVLPNIDWLILEEETEEVGSYLYLMKKESKVLEFRKEQHIEGLTSVKTIQGLEKLCGACGLSYIMGVMKYREPIIDQRQNLLLDVGRAIRKFGFNEIIHLVEKKYKPKIIKPTGKALSGIHIHSNDSFREMIELWKELDYVDVEYSEETPYVWYNKIGDVLLYDRDTNMWFENSKQKGLMNYRLGLFGNSCCPGPIEEERTRQSIWSYWARYPKTLNEFLKSNKMKSYDERSIESIFLGKIENNVQMKNRTKYDWKSCIELFECVIDSSGKSYKYSPIEYLEKLSNSKFGLCLAGYGPKCHREIEYLANGVVPLVAPECDMDRFLNPLKEGIHYIRVHNPDDVLKVIKETPKEVWDFMSKEGRKYYENNCSPEGLFKLTFQRIKQIDHYAGIGLPIHKSTY